MRRIILCGLMVLIAALGCQKKKTETVADAGAKKGEWVSLFNGKDLSGWFVRGNAVWSVQDGILTGVDGMGHIYADPVVTDFEAKGMFRVSDKGNSGFYFRSNPPQDNPDGFPV